MIQQNEINSFEVHFEYICSTFDRLRENGTNPWNEKKRGRGTIITTTCLTRECVSRSTFFRWLLIYVTCVYKLVLEIWYKSSVYCQNFMLGSVFDKSRDSCIVKNVTPRELGSVKNGDELRRHEWERNGHFRLKKKAIGNRSR